MIEAGRCVFGVSLGCLDDNISVYGQVSTNSMTGIDGEISGGVTFNDYLVAAMRNDKTVVANAIGDPGGNNAVEFSFF